MTKKKLQTYQKPHLSKSGEPQGAKKATESKQCPTFVIQHHGARSSHYDLRLEDEGVLKSWAVPKGPSTNPADKHLAIQTEDHSLEYATFEGVIPEGQYGAGPVIVWDTGTFRNLKEQKSLTKSIHDGELTVWLDGNKLHGGYALVKTNYQGKDNAWLLIKMNDEHAKRDYDICKELPHSVLSGKTVEDLV